PPSKPQILGVDETSNLTWLKNKELDIAGYNIYYSDNNGKEIKQFIDSEKDSFNLSNFLNSKSQNNFWLTSIDNDNNESVRNSFTVSKINDKLVLDRKE
ncbi:MAG: hypothetical protein KDC52_02770, partial [Ignavibacteriae bacterium]|nr:hypothetical protein [Ignavibacteriota bacterium]